MSKTPSKSHSLALKAAAAIAAQDDEDEGPEQVEAKPSREATVSDLETVRTDAQRTPAPAEEPVREPATAPAASAEPAATPKRGRGRPKSKREVEARHTVYLDKARHDALARIAEDRGRSVHSLILEGIDQVIGKPQHPGWQGR